MSASFLNLNFSKNLCIIYIEKEKRGSLDMRIKKLHKILSEWETIRIWGNDENVFLWEGYVKDIPTWYEDQKLIKGPNDCVIDIRYGCSDCIDHIAVFIEEE